MIEALLVVLICIAQGTVIYLILKIALSKIYSCHREINKDIVNLEHRLDEFELQMLNKFEEIEIDLKSTNVLLERNIDILNHHFSEMKGSLESKEDNN